MAQNRKTIFFILFIILNFSFSCETKKEVFEKYYPNGKLEEKVLILNKQNPLSTKRWVYSNTGKLKQLFCTNNGELHGDFLNFHESGKISSKGYAEHGKFEGEMLKYHKNGFMSEKLTYKNDYLDGKYVFANSLGNTYESGIYECCHEEKGERKSRKKIIYHHLTCGSVYKVERWNDSTKSYDIQNLLDTENYTFPSEQLQFKRSTEKVRVGELVEITIRLSDPLFDLIKVHARIYEVDAEYKEGDYSFISKTNSMPFNDYIEVVKKGTDASIVYTPRKGGVLCVDFSVYDIRSDYSDCKETNTVYFAPIEN